MLGKIKKHLIYSYIARLFLYYFLILLIQGINFNK